MQMAKIAGIEDVRNTAIFSAGNLSPSDSMDFCGSCHGSLWDVILTIPKGAETERFQPYRLQQSKCWGKNGDARLVCTACHDPHKQLETDTKSYDHACLSCHPASKAAHRAKKMPGGRCPIGQKDCVTCHMPKVFFPEMHHGFRDHKIRIVREPASPAK
jgi:hypothetical protein